MNEKVPILLVDDDVDTRMLVRDAILTASPDSRVDEVSNGLEAMDYLHRRGVYRNVERPQLVYLDIEMPGMTGQSVLKAIKSDPQLRDIAVVMMTGLDDDRSKHEAAFNGANSYTVKPTDPRELIRSVCAATDYWLGVNSFPAA